MLASFFMNVKIAKKFYDRLMAIAACIAVTAVWLVHLFKKRKIAAIKLSKKSFYKKVRLSCRT